MKTIKELEAEIKARKQSYEDKGRIEQFWKNEKTNMMLQILRDRKDVLKLINKIDWENSDKLAIKRELEKRIIG